MAWMGMAHYHWFVINTVRRVTGGAVRLGEVRSCRVGLGTMR